MIKLPACLRRVKTTIPRACRVAPCAALLAGCGTIVSTPDTAVRPDAVTRTDLLGPWEGRVVEAGSDKPLDRVLVVGSFGYSRGVGLVAPAGATVVEARTDADGRYRIETPADLPSGPSLRLERFTLIAYLPGFVAYRSDRQWDGTEIRPRRDFFQRGNLVKLARLPAGVPHGRHLEFLGVWGGPPKLREALAWEFERALRPVSAEPAP